MPATTNAVASSSTQTAAPDAESSPSKEATETAHKPKRRALGVDASLILSEGRSKRRRTATPPPKVEKDAVKEESPKNKAEVARQGMEIYNRILAETDADGAVMSKPFMKLPSPKTYADYYELIKKPMALDMILEKLKAEEYDTLEAVRSDFGCIFNNAKRYNTKDSLLFQYAKDLHKISKVMYDKLTATVDERSTAAAEDSESDREGEPTTSYGGQTPGAGGEDEEETDKRASSITSPGLLLGKQPRKRGNYSTSGPTVYRLIKPALKSLMTMQSPSRPARRVADMFMTLPSREDFPDYFQVIITPISFEQIEKRLQLRHYRSVDEFFTDVERMCDNAMYFNMEGSDVHKDAVEMKARIPELKAEIEKKLAKPPPKSIKLKIPPAQPPASPAVPSTSTSTPPTQAILAPQPAAKVTATAKPGLPRGIVNAEVVSQIRYHPQAEQLSWAASLTGSQQITLQTLLTQARVQPSAVVIPVKTTPQTPIPVTVPAPAPVAASPVNTHTRAEPLVACIDFAFRQRTAEPATTCRFVNLRGMANHAVTVGLKTDVLNVTAEPSASVESSLITKANGSAITSSPVGVNASDRSRHWSIPFPLQLSSMVIEIGSVSVNERAPTVIYVNRQI